MCRFWLRAAARSGHKGAWLILPLAGGLLYLLAEDYAGVIFETDDPLVRDLYLDAARCCVTISRKRSFRR